MAEHANGPSPRDDLVRALIGPVLLLLAAGILLTRHAVELPHTEVAPVARADISTAPVREAMQDPPSIRVGGYELRCRECHRLFPPPAREHFPLMQHRHIVLDHGINDRCFNCHHRTDRNRLALSSGDPLLFAEAPRLCADCHGTTYRDWERGVHGRTNGYWDATRGPRRRLICTECHDPHAPAFDPMRPLPGPHTLRLGPRHEGEHADDDRRRNPLQQWKTVRPRKSDASPPGDGGEVH